MKRFLTLLKNEMKLSIRDMNMLIFAIAMPLVILIVLGVIYGGKPAFCILRRTAAVGAVVQRPLCGLSSGRN